MTDQTEALVEIVARAMAAADKKDPDAPAWIRHPGGDTYGICWRDQYADKARIAVLATLKGVRGMDAASIDTLISDLEGGRG